MRRRAALGVVLVVLTIILSGCASTAAKIIVVTATPAPTPSPTVSATPSPTQRAGGFQLTGVQVENGSLAPGETAILDYTIDNETGTAQDVTLGASIYSDGKSQSTFNDPSHDASVTAQPGSHVYSRQFFLPMASGGQTFDVLASVNAPSFTHLYSEERYNQLLTVAAVQSQPGDATATATISLPIVVQPTYTAAAGASPTAAPSGDTYADVNDHPDLHQGDTVEWTCNIAKFLGSDARTPGNTDIGCWEYTGTYDGGTGDGEILLNVPSSIDTSAMHSGDDLQVTGQVDVPFQGQNGFGAIITTPQIDVQSLTDLGHDSSTSP